MRKSLFRILFVNFFLALMILRWSDPGETLAMDQRVVVAPLIEEARSAGISETMLSRILCVSVDSRMPPDQTLDLCNIFIKARKANLPLEPLIGKMEEGVAKGIPSNKLISALESKTEDYHFVRTLLITKFPPKGGDEETDDQLTALAESLSSGISRDEMKNFINQAPIAPLPMLAVAVENWTLLRQMGFDEKLTSRIISTGLRSKSFTPSWRYLSNIVLASRNKGIPDSSIADATVKSLSEKQELNTLMDRLGFTGRDLRHGPDANGTKPSGR